MSNFCVNFP
uniref:Uncharacterized protein n=1 Tax=Arundo donax TaxID=35708 RepID=A0A0A9EJR6_ARUDO